MAFTAASGAFPPEAGPRTQRGSVRTRTQQTLAGLAWSTMIRLPSSCCLALVLGLALWSGVSAQAGGGSPAPVPSLVPRTARVTPKPGSFPLTGATVIATDAATRALGAMLADYLFPATRRSQALRAPPCSRRLAGRISAAHGAMAGRHRSGLRAVGGRRAAESSSRPRLPRRRTPDDCPLLGPWDFAIASSSSETPSAPPQPPAERGM